jgi:transcriptional regulator with XRE-family HTH domain
MKIIVNHYIGFRNIRLTAFFFIGVAVLLGMRFLIDNVSSQGADQASKEPEKYMQKEERSAVEVLRSKQLQRTSPEQVSEAMNELGKIARLRGISSIDTLKALAEYLDVHQDSLIPVRKEKSKPPGIVYEPHPIMPESKYPAVVALIETRRAALPVLVNAIETKEPGSVASDNAIFVVKYNFREDFNIAADYLRESAELAKSEEGRQRLLIASDKVFRKIK